MKNSEFKDSEFKNSVFKNSEGKNPERVQQIRPMAFVEPLSGFDFSIHSQPGVALRRPWAIQVFQAFLIFGCDAGFGAQASLLGESEGKPSHST